MASSFASHTDDNGDRENGKVCAIENERLDEIETSKFGARELENKS